MKSIKSYGTIREGQLKLFRRDQLLQDLKALEGCDIELSVKERGRRTLPQNNYYFGIVVPTIRAFLVEHGNRLTDHDVHLMLKLRFIPNHIHDDQGEVVDTLPGSTTALNKDEMSAYIDRVIEWARDRLGLEIPPPNTQTELFAA